MLSTERGLVFPQRLREESGGLLDMMSGLGAGAAGPGSGQKVGGGLEARTAGRRSTIPALTWKQV